MTENHLHPDEFPITSGLVKKLVSAQFPQWDDLDICLLDSGGTDNKLYRLGVDKVVRLPRIESAAESLAKEAKFLPFLAPQLPIPIPEVLGHGLTSDDYPYDWLVTTWLEGNVPKNSDDLDFDHAAKDLARFVNAMQNIDTAQGPECRRGQPLSLSDNETRASISLLKGEYDIKQVENVWDRCVSAEAWQGSAKWIHGDLHPGNILVQNGKISAILDFGLMGIGDPAVDLIPAWTLLDKTNREVFQTLTTPDTHTWNRARGWALRLGILGYPYYKISNPTFAKIAKRALDEALFD